MMRSTVSLAPCPWSLRPDGGDVLESVKGQRFTAQLPGCVHLDLIQAGVVEHPDLADAEVGQLWVGLTRWIYSTQFDVAQRMLESERVDLVMDEIDGTATIWLNGESMQRCESRWYPHRIPVGAKLRSAGNVLGVAFEAPVTEVNRLAQELGTRPVNGDWTPYVFQRRAACQFGWDWGPKVATAGVRVAPLLEGWTGARLAFVRPLVTLCSESLATLEVHCDCEIACSGARVPLSAHITLALDDGRNMSCEISMTPAREGFVTMTGTLEIPNPPRWWPAGEGAQRLHSLSVSLTSGSRGEVDRWRNRVGLRSIELITRDQEDQPFTLRVNGRDLFIKGANWIPEGLFQSADDRTSLDSRLHQVCDANLNLLRVWGGGAYETDRFYERCDEYGILVWQDFMFACATYPEEGLFPALVETEARHQVARVCRHPSLALWCGGNENLWGWFSWGFKEKLRPNQSFGGRYWLDLLPRVCAELDPSRPYWTDSPWSGSLDHFPNDRTCGDCHVWDASLEQYRLGEIPRFVSEFGHQSYPCWSTLNERIAPDALALPSKELLRRQRGTGGDEPFIDRFILERFHPPSTQHERVWMSQWLHAHSVRIGMSWWRLSRPRCAGAIVWMFNDAWAGPSQSAVDVAGRPKPMWWSLRDVCAPRRAWIVPDSKGQLALRAVNDLQDSWRATVCVQLFDLATGQVQKLTMPFEVPCASVANIATIESLFGAQVLDSIQNGRTLAVCDTPLGRDVWIPELPIRLALQDACAEVVTRPNTQSGSIHLSIKALSPIVDLWIDPVGPFDHVSHNLVTLLPGESIDVEIVGSTIPPVLQHLNGSTLQSIEK